MCLAEQRLHALHALAGLARLSQHIEQDHISKILLDVGHPILRNRINLRHIDILGMKMPCYGQKGLIFAGVGTDYADAGTPTAAETEVFTVACRAGQRDYGLRGCGIMSGVKIGQFVHSI